MYEKYSYIWEWYALDLLKNGVKNIFIIWMLYSGLERLKQL